MLIVERQHRILQILREQRTADLDALATALDVSVSTVRRDLEALEEQGLVERTHGGAIYRGEHRLVMDERMQQHVEAKRAIGRYAAGLVEPNMTVIFDGGSTVVYCAQQIAARPIQIVTTSLHIANLFADDEEVELMLVGGTLYPRSGVTVGPIATRCLADLHGDLLLFSLAGIYEQAAYNQNMAMAEVERVMLRQAARSVLMMDSSKFGRKSLARVCDVAETDAIVTDTGIGPRWREALAERLVVAD